MDRRVHSCHSSQRSTYFLDRHHPSWRSLSPLRASDRDRVRGQQLPPNRLTEGGPQQGVQVADLSTAHARSPEALMPCSGSLTVGGLRAWGRLANWAASRSASRRPPLTDLDTCTGLPASS